VGDKTAFCRLGKTLFLANAQKIDQLPMIHSSFYGGFWLRSSKKFCFRQLLVAGGQKISV
jgi:hypothetical protein